MKVKALFTGMLLGFMGLVAMATPAVAPATYIADPVHSTAFFKVGHLGIGFVRGGLTDIVGTVVVDKAKPDASSVQVTIKTDSVFTNNAKRDEHLKSPDFFDVAKYPEMNFKSTKVRKQKGNDYEVTGNFTLHGVTKSIKVIATYLGEGKDPWGGYRAAFSCDFTIKRSDYGMDKMIPMAGDRVDISLIIEGVKK